MSSSDPLTKNCSPLYQKDGHLYTHTSTITSTSPLSSLPPSIQSLFKPPSDTTPHVLTTPCTIFHAQGGGQPSDTGTITCASSRTAFHVHQVRKVNDTAILHMGVFDPTNSSFNAGQICQQSIDVDKRVLHSRIHTAGHVLGLAINTLVKEGQLPPDIVDGKASHYPSAAFVEFSGLIPGTAKAMIQARVDDLVSQNLPVSIHFWSEERARSECTGVLESFKSDGDGVRVVKIGGVGSYPCGGTHVGCLGDVGGVVVRGIKRQKGVSKIGYEVKEG